MVRLAPGFLWGKAKPLPVILHWPEGLPGGTSWGMVTLENWSLGPPGSERRHPRPQTGGERLQATHAGQFQPSRMTDRLSRTGHCATARGAIPDPVGDGPALLGPQHRPLPSPGPWKGLRAQPAACHGVSRASKHDTCIPAQGSSPLRPPGQQLWQPPALRVLDTHPSLPIFFPVRWFVPARVLGNNDRTALAWPQHGALLVLGQWLLSAAWDTWRGHGGQRIGGRLLTETERCTLLCLEGALHRGPRLGTGTGGPSCTGHRCLSGQSPPPHPHPLENPLSMAIWAPWAVGGPCGVRGAQGQVLAQSCESRPPHGGPGKVRASSQRP